MWVVKATKIIIIIHLNMFKIKNKKNVSQTGIGAALS
jgi:hypothetical protein